MGHRLGFCLSLAVFTAALACGGTDRTFDSVTDDASVGGAGGSDGGSGSGGKGGTSGAGGSGGNTAAAGGGGTSGAGGSGGTSDASAGGQDGSTGGDASTDARIDGSPPPDASADADAGCTANAKQCLGQVPQTCDGSTGTWQSGNACVNQACVAGTCTGVCAPGAPLCTGNSVETCSSSGQWGTGVACSWPTPVCVGIACANATLTVAKNGTGSGSVTSAPAGIACGATCSQSFASTPVVLTATPAAGSTFAGWSGGSCAGTGTCSVSLAAGDASVTATFTLLQYALTVSMAGTGTGTVASAPAGIACGASCSASYNYGTSVVLTATAAGGSSFAGWLGGGCSGIGTCTVTMTAATAVTATFSPSGSMSCTTIATSNGCPTGPVPDINLGHLSGAVCHDQCQPAMVTAGMTTGCWVVAPDLNCYCRSGATVTGGTWPGGNCSISQYALTVNKAGTGSGTVTSAPAGIACGATCSVLFNPGANVVLTASAAAGSKFMSWSGGGCSGTGTCTVTMAAATTVTATFSAFSCTTVANTISCTNGGTFAERNLGSLTAAACHDQCQALEAASGTASGCWVLALDTNCYCRGGVMSTGGTAPGGSCGYF
jgi:hypothetical protein